MKKILIIILFAMLVFSNSCIYTSFASDGMPEDTYKIYSNNKFVYEHSNIDEGDIFITDDFSEYEIYSIDENSKTAQARYIDNIKSPKVTKSYKRTSRSIPNKKIGLYLTHNDESYLPTDGYDSIYGKGGVHDVAKMLKTNLEKKGITVSLNETLHIPHDNSAYSRSKSTAQKLLKESPDAIFDIHRDATSRSFYFTQTNGVPRSKIRIVVGKNNPNFEKNFEFATSIFTIGNELYPNLFVDIYCGKNQYNQNLSNKALIFEMGTYLIEKELVYNTVPMLADALNTTLYGTTIDEEGNLEIGGEESPTVNEKFEDTPKTSIWIWLIPTLIIITLASFIIYYFYNKKRLKSEKLK